MRQEIMFAGSGGQGVITASIILAEAAGLYEGYNVVQSQVYGPEARGGSSSSHVIISDQEIGYPKVVQPHILVCLTQESLAKFSPTLRPGGILLTDRFFARRMQQFDARIYNLDIYRQVKERIGLPIVFNVSVLGALSGLTQAVQPDSLRKVISQRVPARFLKQNMDALDLGLELAEAARIWRADLPEGLQELPGLPAPGGSGVLSSSSGEDSPEPHCEEA